MLCVISSFTIITLVKRGLVALLLLSYSFLSCSRSAYFFLPCGFNSKAVHVLGGFDVFFAF